mgnify:CR=1 FL=1
MDRDTHKKRSVSKARLSNITRAMKNQNNTSSPSQVNQFLLKHLCKAKKERHAKFADNS